ncbi:MAG: DUF4956 domain-containing protein [Planctomycetota bacterium]|nr:DUF4956 domain-containing protein [Planctomycetota bacterium]
MEAFGRMSSFGYIVGVTAIVFSTVTPLLLADGSDGKKKETLPFSSGEEDLIFEQGMNLKTFVEVFKRVGLAALLGAAIALHPLRIRRRQRISDPLRLALAIRAQVLICSAGALMVVVIAGSLARAFGLVGLGSFVRFRTTIKDPTDTAVLFLLVGIGMACGLGAYAVALFGALAVMCVLAMLELKSVADQRVFSITMKAPDELVNKAVQYLRSKAGLKIHRFSLKVKKESAVVDISLPAGAEGESIVNELRALGDFSELSFEEVGE